MSSGTSGGYWDEKALPSVFKHELLKRYLPPFGGMTGSHARDKRVVYLDGYAGEGRYESGEPGSAEIALQVASRHRSQGLTLSCFFVEQQAKSFARLEEVVSGYRGRGVQAVARQGGVDDVLDDVLRQAVQAPLFLFLDPCGLCLPLDRLASVFRQRPHRWPPTELLMNFSMMAVRRIGGHVRSAKGNEKTLQRFDAVCGGTWWREHFAAGRPDAAERVAAEYGRRLGRRAGLSVVSVPVAHKPGDKPVYHLVFGTRSPYGLWVFGDTVARARNEWWKTLELREEDTEMTLFSTASLKRPDPGQIADRAIPEIAGNLGDLLQRTERPVKLVDHTLEVLGRYYGQVTDPVVRKAVQLLHQQGGTLSNGVGERHVRNIILRPGAVAA
ncbi:three-Cys-motif partner protein TcmP [Streptomyces sp. NPDC086796]|uniref:three-Cys-motif partner protein TcmP n=1 Tax=unclassified Streptomyces TaxID=2593676 RepID=UPI0036F50B91